MRRVTNYIVDVGSQQLSVLTIRELIFSCSVWDPVLFLPLDLDQRSGMEKNTSLGSGFRDGKIRIQDKHPGSATLFSWLIHAEGLVSKEFCKLLEQFFHSVAQLCKMGSTLFN
jgi:hypothetical protein